VRDLLNMAARKLVLEGGLDRRRDAGAACGTLAGAALKLLETVSLVERLESLEKQMSEKGGKAE
jgi:hypothetical protein